MSSRYGWISYSVILSSLFVNASQGLVDFCSSYLVVSLVGWQFWGWLGCKSWRQYSRALWRNWIRSKEAWVLDSVLFQKSSIGIKKKKKNPGSSSVPFISNDLILGRLLTLGHFFKKICKIRELYYMGLAKKFVHNMLWKNPDKHFGQPHINDS